MRLKSMMPLMVSAAMVAGCAAGPAAHPEPVEHVLAAADREVVTVRVGDVLVVRLDSNPSTGYGWTWDESAAAGVLVKDGEPSMSGAAPMPGSGGVQTWRFRAAAPGEVQLQLDYLRPWEKGTPPVRTVRWSVQVR